MDVPVIQCSGVWGGGGGGVGLSTETLKHANESITGGNELMVVTRNHVEGVDTSTLLSVMNGTIVDGGIIDVFFL